MSHRIPEMENRITKIENKMNWLLALGILSFLLTLYRTLQLPGTAPQTVPATQNQSVKIGQTPETPPGTVTAAEHLETLTVQQVARELGISDRAVITAIAEDRILPEPSKPGNRAWAIAKDYRYLPPSQPLTAAESR